MIKEKEITVTLAAGLVPYFRNLGYVLPTHVYRNEIKVTINVPFKVKVTDLPKKSHAKITAICVTCGKERTLRFHKYTPHCKKCSGFKISEALTGENNGMFGRRRELHPNWNPIKTDAERLAGKLRFQSKEAQRWSREIKEIYDFTCQKCNTRGGTLESHHIESWRANVNLRFEISNGICLCEKCHARFHKIYGKKVNNRSQLNQFLELKND